MLSGDSPVSLRYAGDQRDDFVGVSLFFASFSYFFAVTQDDNPVDEFENVGDVVADDDDGNAEVIPEVLDEI